MNYFELFEIPVQFRPDLVVVKKKFYELSRKYHPDFYSRAGGEKQAEVLETSSMVNKAYKTFLDEDATMRYILKLHGLLEEEEKYELDKAYLMEVLELNELLMEADADDEASLQEIRRKTEAISNELYNDIKPILEHYQEGVTSEKELLQVKDYYFKKKYLQRILDKLG